MTRVRSNALVLVNWKGVFYERYLLDDRVTALEGDNGAGKTTVMIAAYVALLPDMTRLRFTNVGESDASGGDKGIWGRLGNPNRPSYSALAFTVGAEHIIAGVLLERKGEPSVELTPFLISDLQAETRLQDVFLVRSGGEDHVPELADLRENVASLGGSVQFFKSAKDYFIALFDRGITPLRLVADEERTRFNDMLRTSMTGGISRALASEFRSFLLKEETGLADTLVRMRGNLDACRRTRLEVREAQDLEREISAVYEAGHNMFAASLLATRQRALELQRRFEEATERRDLALRERDHVAAEHLDRIRERTETERQLAEFRERLELARKSLDNISRAHAIAIRISGFDTELETLNAKLTEVTTQLEGRNEVRIRREQEKERAEIAYRRAADGLADLQQGLEELHRRADAYRTTTRRLEDAGTALDIADNNEDDLEDREQTAERELGAIDRKLNDLDRAIASAGIHRTRHAEGLKALSVILQRQVEEGKAFVNVEVALRHLADLEVSAGREQSIEKDLLRTQRLLARQQAACAAAQALELPQQTLNSSQDVQKAFQEAALELRALEEDVRELTAQTEAHKRAEQTAKNQLELLQARQLRWRELDSVAKRLEDTLGSGLRTVQELETARQLLDEERDQLQSQIESLERNVSEASERARLLEQTGGVFHHDLLAARDAVGGELLAGHFDDLEPLPAATMQALLGPLAEAIVVDNAREAARVLDDRPRELETIWLVQGGSLDKLARQPTGSSGNHRHVIVENEGIVRTTQIPARPTLGRRARQRVVKELHAETGELRGRILGLKEDLARIDARRAETAMLMRELATLELGDPASSLASVAAESAARSEQARATLAATTTSRACVSHASERVKKLEDLYGQASLLDEGDLAKQVQELEESACAAAQARIELKRVSQDREALSERIDALQSTPMSEAETESAQAEFTRVGDHRQRVFLGLNALKYVIIHREELRWSDAQASLSSRQNLVPALKEQCDNSDRALKEALAVAQAAEHSWEEMRDARHKVENSRDALEASRARAEQELEELGVRDATETAVARAQQAVKTFERRVQELDQKERNLANAIAKLGERLENRNKALAEAEDHLIREEKEWQPAKEMWERLRAQTESRNLLTPTITRRLLETAGASVKHFSDARTQAGLLEDRLSKAKGADDALTVLRSWLSRQDMPGGSDVTEVWESVRQWLSRRVPVQIAELDDPLESLERLRQHLTALAARLESQETELRGASEDVARGIEVHIRSAHRQVGLLNRELEGVHFGTIRSIRIRLERDNHMEAVLAALREGTAQELLFATTMPVEEALEQLFTRYSGRGSTLGQRLLDYREYLEIGIEIGRQGSSEWERVNPSRLSTGEAIGIGTALMMVVLTAWEQSANLFRPKRAVGTLRFLFLDEANRLSQDNLEVLFQLCTTLDLQLLIASPEVANVVGCTTYRLARRETPDGGEQVLVSGRRAVKDTSNVGD